VGSEILLTGRVRLRQEREMKDQLRAVNQFTRAPLKSYAPHNLIKSGGRAVLSTQQTLQSNTSLFSPPEMVVSPSSASPILAE